MVPTDVVSRQSGTWAEANMDNSSANLLDTLRDGFFVPLLRACDILATSSYHRFSLRITAEFNVGQPNDYLRIHREESGCHLLGNVRHPNL
jgi:hypothetical protein